MCMPASRDRTLGTGMLRNFMIVIPIACMGENGWFSFLFDVTKVAVE